MKQEIVDHGDPRKYYAAIPRIVLKLGLKPFELALYVHLKDAAGDKGVCFKSRATLAKESGMSSGMVTKARQALEKHYPELGDKPLIHVKEEINKEGGKPRCIITITDVWLVNMQRFTTSPHDVAASSTGLTTSQSDSATSPRDGQRHTATPQGHTVAPNNSKEEEHTKKNTEEKSRDFLSELKTDPTYSRLDVGLEFGKAQRWAAANHRRVTERMFVNWLNRGLENLPLNANGSGKPKRDAAWHAKQAELARRMGYEYRPDASQS